jgi:gliding motility-associated-like protein
MKVAVMIIKKYITGLLFFSVLWMTAGAQTYLISDGGTINTCSGTLYDSGGASGDYSNNEYYTMTVCSDVSGTPVELYFVMFDVESATWDNLTIYDGPNTGSPVLAGPAGSSDLQDETITASGDCLTLVWETDGSVTYPGFEIDISCAMTCQDYSIDIVSTSPGLSPPVDSMWIDVCQGDQVTFTAEGTYPNNNTDYLQSDDNVTWEWTASSGNTTIELSGQGENEFSPTFTESGGYFISLVATDINGCTETFSEEYRVRVSMDPIYDPITIDQDTVCPGDPVNFNGNVSTDTWVMPIADEQVVQECITDQQGVTQEFCWNVSAFQPGQTINSGNELESVCMNIEHSWVADLWIYVQCPNGQQAEINYYSTGNPCSGDYFGEPDHADDCNPGVGYDYCWSMNASQSHTDWCDAVGGTVPSDTYLPTGTFDDLVGCPINGEWCVVVIDDWGSDDGTLFEVSLNFDNSITPADTWTIEHTYDSDDIFWSGNGMQTNSGGSATAYPDTPGDQDYTFSVIDDFGCQYDTTFTVHVRDFGDDECCVTPVADVDPLADEVCSDTYTFHTTLDSSINTVEWSQISGPGTADFGGQENSTDPTVMVDEWGVYEFQLVEQNMSPACSDTAVVEIGFFLTPNAQFTTTFIPCYDDSTVVEYVGNATDSASFTWDFDGGTASGAGSGPFNVTWTEPGNHDITLSVEDNGCLSGDTVQTVLVPEELTYTLTVEDDPCYQTCDGWAQIDVQGGTLPYDYSWGTNNLNENLCAGDYSITVTDVNGCEISDTYTINEPPELIITDTSYQHLSCFDADDGEIHVTANGGTGTLNYSWSDGGSGPDRVDLPAGNYYLTVTDENGCIVNENFTLTQPEELLVSMSPDDAICEGQTINISTQTVGGTEPYVYYWDLGAGFSAGGNMLMVAPDTTTTYSVYVEDAHGCESPIQSMTVTVSPEMSMQLIIDDNTCYQSCDGEAQLNVSGGLDPFDYSWAADGHIYQNMCAGMYNVTVTDIIGCQIDTVFFIDEPPQMLGHIYAEPASCYGYDDGLAWVEVNGGTPGYSYLWPDGTTNDSVNVGAGVHEVTVTDVNNCRLTMSADVSEPSLLQVHLNSVDHWICKTNSTQLSAQATGGTPYGGGEYDFHWQGTNGSTYNVRNPVVSPDTTTIYTVYVTDAHGCSSASDDVKVKVYPDLEIDYIASNRDSVCPGEPVSIEVDVSGGNGGPYTLTLQNGNVVASPFTVYPDETTNYIITLHDACGSPTVKDSIEINVMPEPPVSFIADDVEGCPPFVVNFSELNENENFSYSWDFGDSNMADIKNPTHVYENSGSYSVSLTATSVFGCKNKKTVVDMIYVYPAPDADFYAEPKNVSILDPQVNFVNLSEHADSSFWFFGDGDSSHFTSPTHIYNDIGEFEVMLIAENEEGCQDTLVKKVLVQNEFTFYAPTAFTPNGDGHNDFFMIFGEGIDPNEFSLRVYDRWGELVFEADNYNNDKPIENAWDGTLLGNRHKGDPLLKGGVYYWFCKYKDYTGIWHEKEGTVTLIR